MFGGNGGAVEHLAGGCLLEQAVAWPR